MIYYMLYYILQCEGILHNALKYYGVAYILHNTIVCNAVLYYTILH